MVEKEQWQPPLRKATRAGQPRTDQAGAADRRIDRGMLDLLTTCAPIGRGTVLADDDGFLRQLDLLVDPRRFDGQLHRPATAGTLLQAIVDLRIDLIGCKRFSLVLRMTRLAALLSLALGGCWTRWLGNITRRRLRRIGGVLLGFGQLIGQLDQPSFQCRNPLFILGTLTAGCRP